MAPLLALNMDESVGPCSVMGHVTTLPWVRSGVWVRVRLGSRLASGKGWVGTWLTNRLDPNKGSLVLKSNKIICAIMLSQIKSKWKVQPLKHRIRQISHNNQTSQDWDHSAGLKDVCWPTRNPWITLGHFTARLAFRLNYCAFGLLSSHCVIFWKHACCTFSADWPVTRQKFGGESTAP